jgi:hypothetical protein
MGFYFNVAPGVRIRATSRGLRASAGPRAARVHFGAGGTGFSTGAGPVTLYKSTGRRRPPHSTGSSQTSAAAYQRQLRQAEKSQQAHELKAAFDSIMNLHRQDFPAATAPIAPAPQHVDEGAIRQWHEEQALSGLNALQRSARANARHQAAEAANRDIHTAIANGLQERARLQLQLNQQWQRLLANDPDIVFATLSEAFEDNEAPAAVAGVHGSEASVLVIVPDIEAVPERTPRLTQAGNLSIVKLTKSDRNSFYLQLVCGHVLATVREALAVAPGLQSVRVAVVRRTPLNAYGARNLECLLAALLSRQRLQGIRWDTAESARIVQDASTELLVRLSATHEMLPLDLSREAGLAALLQVIDSEEAMHPLADEGQAAGPVDSVASQQPGTGVAPGQHPGTLSQVPRRETGFAAPVPPPRAPGPGRRRRGNSRPLNVRGLALAAIVVLIVIIALVSNHGNGKQAASTANTTTPTATATHTPTPTPRATKKKKRHERPKTTPTPAQPTIQVSATTASAAAPAPAPTPTPQASCYPLSNEGTCYEPGEYCRDDDHGASGVAGDGEAITCEYNDGWRWEPS